MTTRTIAGKTPYEIYCWVANQATRNVLVALAGSAFVYWLSGVWRLGAQLIFWLFVVVTATDALQVAGILGSGAAAAMATAPGDPARRTYRWLHAASAVRVGQLLLATGLLFLLFQRIW